MHRRLVSLIIIAFSAMLVSLPPAVAQLRIVGSISGTVQDPTGAVVANASVTLKDLKTSLAKETTTNDRGSFQFPDLASGTYQITVSMAGFKTELLPNVSVSTSKTTDLLVTLEVGEPTETVTITEGAGQVLESSSQLVANTLVTKSINELPLGSRTNALALARLAQGASPPIGGDTRYNNLPGGAVNVTVDGINDASNGFKSGGTVFFMTVPVRLGALEEQSVETVGLGADSGAQSGANIKFTTKRGGDEYHGSGFYEPQSERFNANTWTRNAQGLDRLLNRTQNYGFNFGGPLVPFTSLKKKSFFFVNYERAYSPILNSRVVTVLTPAALSGIYTYLDTSNQIRTANVLALGATKAGPRPLDSVTQNILATNNKIPLGATQIADTDLNRDSYTWGAENNNYAYFPAARFDVFATPKHQVTWTWNYRHNWQAGERRIPVPDISRTNPFRLGYFIWSAAIQSTFSPRTLNEFRYGTQHSGDTNASSAYGPYFIYQGVPLRIGGNLQFANSPGGGNPTSPVVPFIDQVNTTGRHFITTIYDTVTLERGNHTFTTGFSYRKTDWKDTAEVFAVPTYGTGTPQNDPLQVSTAFTTGTMPGINSTEVGNPLALYNMLTGRVSQANFTKVVDPDTFNYDGFINYTWTRSVMGGAYFQDRWRMRRNLTVNYGLRWEVQGPMHDVKELAAVPDLANIYGPSKALFSPGDLSGNNNPTMQVGLVPYSADKINFAPNFGIAWNPSGEKGVLGKIFGDKKSVIRASYSLIYYDEGTQFFAANLGPNVGKTISATTLRPGQSGQTNLPAFYSLSDIVTHPLTVSNFAFTSTTYPKVFNMADQTFSGRTISGFDPKLRAPYTETYTIGIQRELWRNTVLEVAYVGTQSHLAWRTSNLNEVDIFGNGFLQEFKNAQSNLAIFKAANPNCDQTGQPACSFAFNSSLAGSVALPIFQAAFGSRGALGAISAGSGFASTAFKTNLTNGEAGALATTLAIDQNYVCRMFGSNFSPCARVLPSANAPGVYPINFFLLNPFAGNRLNFVDNGGWNSYNGLQIQFRQRLTRGLNWTTNYTWSKSLTNLAVDVQNQSLDYTTLRNNRLDHRLSPFDITHVIQTFGTYDLPIGRGRWLDIKNPYLNGVIGGWTLGSIFVFNTGQPIQLTGGFQTVNNTNNPSQNGVQLAPGVTLDQIEQMFHAALTRLTGRPAGTTTDLQRLAVDPALIGPDFRANPAFLIPNKTPGSFGQLLFLRDRNTFQWDVSMTKKFNVTERAQLVLFAGFNNFLNHPRWGFPTANVFSTSFGVVGAPTGNRSINLRATLSF